MAQLFRVSKLYDSSESQTFTFILPPAAALEYPSEILSRDFVYAGHKWRISLLKQDRHLSPHLQMTSVSEGVRCWIDFAFLLVHRQSFTDSEQYSERQTEFSWRHSSHGCRTFVTLDDLSKRQFSDARGEFIFEVVIKNPKTVFEQIFSLSVIAKTSTTDRHADTRDYQRYDTTPISFGEQDWVCVFCPNMDAIDNGSMRHMVQLNRRSRSDTLCKVRYRIILGRPQTESCCLRSETREEIFDFIGNGEAFYFTDDYFQYAHDGNRLQLTLELNSISYINHMKLNVLSTDKRPVAQCFDRDRQTWCVTTIPTLGGGGRRKSRAGLGTEVDMQDTCLSFTMLYPDVQNIPRNYLRFVSWSFNVIPVCKKRETPCEIQPIESVTALAAPFEHYYSQMETDNGFVMKTKLTLNEVRENAGKWLDDVDQRLTVQLEWLGSYLLFHPAYHAYDDIYRKHILQMRREVQALQAENNELEKQVHDFQLMHTNRSGSGSGSPTRPRTASASSKVSGAGNGNLQPPAVSGRNPPPGSQLAPTQHRNSTVSLEDSSDGRRPARSVSGMDVATVAIDRTSTTRRQSGSAIDQSMTYRNGFSQYPKLQDMLESESEHRPEYADYNSQEIMSGFSPPTATDPTRQNPQFLSPSKKFSPRMSTGDSPIFDIQVGAQPVHCAGSTRSTARSAYRRESAQKYDYYEGEDGYGNRSEYLSAEGTPYMEPHTGHGGGALVRSKSASPYPQRHHLVHPTNAYWRTETPPRSDDEARGGSPRHLESTRVDQLKPELLRFGDDSRGHHRNRSFRMNQHRDRKISSPRRLQNYGREAEDIGEMVNQGAYYYRR